MSPPKLQITPIGGVGQIGSNMTLFEFEETRILVDCGILFPFEDFFDINYLIPNISEIGKLDALVITHGHEDHIGAISHIYQQYPDLKVYSPSLAAELIRFKLNQKKISSSIEIYNQNSVILIGELEIHPIHVNHSIPQTFGLLFTIQKLDLACFFVSDFKVDTKTPYEAPFDFQKLAQISSPFKRRYLLADSTNILSKNEKTTSEADLIPDIEKLFQDPGRIFATCFSSNLHRVQTFINCAAATDRHVVLYGGSMCKYTEIALNLGLIEDPKKVLKETTQVSALSEKLVVLCSGSQGEFKSTMTRVIRGEDSRYKPQPTDLFLFSSKAIPGNEKKLSMLFNIVSEVGAKLVTDQTHLVHASGHPGKKDLTLLFECFKPTHFTPIHGETLFLEKHRDFMESSFQNVIIVDAKNFHRVSVTKKDFDVERKEQLDPILIHGNGIEIDRKNISERRKIACNGAVFISWGSKLSVPQISFSGVTNAVNDKKDQLPELISQYFHFKDFKSMDKLSEEIRIFTRRYFFESIGQKPIVFVHILP